MTQTLLRHLPSIDRWLASSPGRSLCAEFSRAEVRASLQSELAALRTRIADGQHDLPDFDGATFEALLRARLLARRRGTLHPTINATGVVIHTNLGRAPLAPEAAAALAAVAQGYSNLELDLDSGARGARNDHVESLLTTLTGAEAALAINNCASAVLLTLAAFAKDQEVVVSRGELIEIGGSFRLPDVIAASGARMIEVGTTNRTSFADYDRAIGPATRVLLISHPSNYRVVGFTTTPTIAELADLAHTQGRLCIHDLGSGCLVDLEPHGLAHEPTVGASVDAGADLVLFSADKLLGGPQAGLIVGRQALVDRLRNSPLARAMRLDKLSLAALRATLELYLPPYDPFRDVPVLRMLCEPLPALRERSAAFLEGLRRRGAIEAELVATEAYAGGGTLPTHAIDSVAVCLRHAALGANELAARLRCGSPAVVARISDEAVLLDLRSVQASEVDALLEAVVAAASA